MRNSLCSLNGWEVLSISEYGEAVMGYQNEDTFVVTKLRSLTGKVPGESVYHAYIAKLKDEVRINRIDSKVISVDTTVWQLYLITVEGNLVEYVLYAWAIVDGYNCVIEATFLSAGDYLKFMEHFSAFSSSINFRILQKEVGFISLEDGCVSVTGISDVVLQHNSMPGTLMFVGKNKYFAVTVVDTSQHTPLAQTIKDDNLEFISTFRYEAGTIERYRISNGTLVTGVIEMYSRKVSDKFIEIFGYWLNDTNASISDNIALSFKQEVGH